MSAAEQKKFDSYLRWSNHRAELRSANDRIKAAKLIRGAELVEMREGCHLSRRALVKRCADGRAEIRKRAKDVEATQRAHKKREWIDYSMRVGGTRKEKRMSRAENDSLAEHNIPPELIQIWREDRKTYDYKMAPDMRAEQFLEYAELNADEMSERQQAMLEKDWPDLAYARDQGKHDQEQEEAVPF